MKSRIFSLVIVIPLYRPTLGVREISRVELTLRNAANFDVAVVAPLNLDLTRVLEKWERVRVERFDPAHFSSAESYSNWLMTPELYERFSQYTFILVSQTDAMLTSVPLPGEWDFDYVGARWSPPHVFGWVPGIRTLTRHKLSFQRKILEVGNGGLSIRRTQAFIQFTSSLPKLGRYVPEDILISYFGPGFGLSLAGPSTASKLFMETEAATWDESKPIPECLGFHALEKHNLRLEDTIFFLHGVHLDY